MCVRGGRGGGGSAKVEAFRRRGQVWADGQAASLLRLAADVVLRTCRLVCSRAYTSRHGGPLVSAAAGFKSQCRACRDRCSEADRQEIFKLQQRFQLTGVCVPGRYVCACVSVCVVLG